LRNAWDSYQEPTHCVNGVDRSGPNAENPESVARTPLMRAVRRLAAEHQAAEQLGIEPAELRGERISRRELARRGGMAAAALRCRRHWPGRPGRRRLLASRSSAQASPA